MDFSEDFEEYEDESSEDCGQQLDRLLVPRLPVADFDDYDPNRPPVSGDEYLRRVQLEAQHCPKVVVADMDVNQFKPNQTVVFENTNGFIRAKPELMPSKDWQRAQVSEFTKVRLKFCQMKAKMCLNEEKRLFRNRSMSWWKEYCIGKKSDNASDSSDSEVPSEQSTPTDTPNTTDSNLKREVTKKCKSKPNDPLLSTIYTMSDAEVILVISYHIKWIQQFGFTAHNGVWIYALLVALEKPLPSEVYSTLRELSRVCSECRHGIVSPNESKTLIPLNLIICLIARYFDQNDMTDE